jgi:hypothetical protein
MGNGRRQIGPRFSPLRVNEETPAGANRRGFEGFPVRVQQKGKTMSQATATAMPNQDVVSAIRLEDHPREFEPKTPPSCRVLLVYNAAQPWHPEKSTAIPPRSSMRLNKFEAASLAVMLNRRSLREHAAKQSAGPHRPPGIEWAVVVRSSSYGFFVVMVSADLRNGWKPETPFDLPLGTVGPDHPMRKADAIRSCTEFNSQQLAHSSSPFYWALPVQVITEADLIDRSQFELASSMAKGGAA